MVNFSELFSLSGGWSLLYVVLSLAVAIFTWVRADLMMKKQKKSLNSGFFHIMSMICSLWFFISAAALYFLDFGRYTISVPVMYVIYRIGGLIYSSQLLKDQELPANPDDFIIPDKYLIYSKSFALAFSILCVFILIHDVYTAYNLTN